MIENKNKYYLGRDDRGNDNRTLAVFSGESGEDICIGDCDWFIEINKDENGDDFLLGCWIIPSEDNFNARVKSMKEVIRAMKKENGLVRDDSLGMCSWKFTLIEKAMNSLGWERIEKIGW